MRGLLATVAFLTIIPVPRRWMGERPADPCAMLWWFAPVGLLLGGLAACVTGLVALALPWTSAAAIGVVSLVVLSGGLHLDGFTDTCDGLGSRTPRARALEIMRDPNAGAFGVIGVVCLLLLKLALIAGMEPYWGLLAIGLAPVAGRLMQVVVLRTFSYARVEGGMGAAFFTAATKWHCLTAILCAACIPAFLALHGVGGRAVAALLFAMLSGGLCAHWISRRLGGHTGDTVGAVSEVSELAFMLALAALSTL